MRRLCLLPVILSVLPVPGTSAADRFFGFNETTSTTFAGVYLAPAGTATWGPNEAANDKDKIWDPGERLTIKNIKRGHYDLKLVDRAGRVCMKLALDLTNDLTFDIRDPDLAQCKP